MSDDAEAPRRVDVPDDHDGRPPEETDDLEVPIDPADPLKRGEEDPDERQPGLDPTPPPIAPE